jgi:hypothetical protein
VGKENNEKERNKKKKTIIAKHDLGTQFGMPSSTICTILKNIVTIMIDDVAG